MIVLSHYTIEPCLFCQGQSTDFIHGDDYFRKCPVCRGKGCFARRRPCSYVHYAKVNAAIFGMMTVSIRNAVPVKGLDTAMPTDAQTQKRPRIGVV